jgi:ubiquinone/menaquinone biosynthesis C-methylase UbiE
MSAFVYIGSELELFASAIHWKTYLRSHLAPFIGQRVLEVGAGSGNTTKLLCDGTQESWVCLEPDDQLGEQLRSAIRSGELPPRCQVVVGTLADLPRQQPFDTIIYIDVLEHIEDDCKELERAMSYLQAGGHLIVLAPAHRWLFTAFDHAIGHFRRYTKASLRAVMPKDLSLVCCRYVDSVGLLASLANRLALHQSMPTLSQVLWWDRRLVPLSRGLDRLLGYRLGKSVLGVWRLPSTQEGCV